MLNSSFSEDSLIPCEWQYSINQERSEQFIVGESVFLKSNPEYAMTVHAINKETVSVMSKNGQIYDFPPQCILQYTFAAFRCDFERKLFICLN